MEHLHLKSRIQIPASTAWRYLMVRGQEPSALTTVTTCVTAHTQYTLIILANLLRCVLCKSLTWWRNVDVNEIMSFTVHVTLSLCCRETPEFIPPEMWPGYPICQIWIQWTTASGVSFKRGSVVCRSMIWRSWIWNSICWVSEGCWTTPSLWQLLHSGVVVWMQMFTLVVDILNINFEPLIFLLCFVGFIDTGSPKCDRYKRAKC